ncbi:STAS domain-containing protein [Actinoplanes utahensis]|uniref:STAS domain-containing protein n=1 Tax=Actinoplanes utahensis TaxID=1869 RepID=A0A0A6UGS1_ACTUT|nr:STAS domain-containing protein [Actinoplanes utahensis]KHD74651.1 hypothetical protein MB27_27540 [Actinoplanes utahensis]GIF31509.1 hypothetical protein Aut01nite_44950 [Actinoplanes utahensis]
MTGPFAVSKHHDGDDAVRLLVVGDIDHDVSEALSHILINAVEQPGVRTLVVDLGRVPTVAASGIRSLMVGRQEALRRGCHYRVTNAHGLVGDMLRAAGVAEFLSLPPEPAVRARHDGPAYRIRLEPVHAEVPA